VLCAERWHNNGQVDEQLNSRSLDYVVCILNVYASCERQQRSRHSAAVRVHFHQQGRCGTRV